jgi:hypothetical protein
MQPTNKQTNKQTTLSPLIPTVRPQWRSGLDKAPAKQTARKIRGLVERGTPIEYSNLFSVFFMLYFDLLTEGSILDLSCEV